MPCPVLLAAVLVDMDALLRHPGIVLSKTAILERVYDYSFDPQTNVIDVHVSRLRQKIDRDRGPPLLHTVRGMGYVLEDRSS